ncbi:spore germination protein [Sporanaerobium hydrogeniformans]|uniref:Spore germination protein n=1 Tax=Sporanaerobium hydrogeniformans TaxID=3072179 RepID=A0AC61DBV8_9FIRM|nr:spore germination protein [Sporanaerobium hydrogeniformans]PHV70131.1 spore germination protein [Sporanaerobium hydrogeniformans]
MPKEATKNIISNEDNYHDKNNKINIQLSKDLAVNIQNIELLFKNCMDVVKRQVDIGKDFPFKIYGVYVDGMINRDILEHFFLGRIIDYKNLQASVEREGTTPSQLIMQHFSATFDIKETDSMDAMVNAVLSGDSAIFIDHSEKGLIISNRAWPNRGVGEPTDENVVRGPKDAFTETIRFNTVLIRRRIRDTKLKVKMMSYGIRSRTDVAIMYVEDIVKPELLEEVMRRLNKYEIDAIYDSGYIEQLVEDSWKSPFPQTQATERPDKVASSLLEGKVAIIVDNSPFVIVVPTTLNAFYQASEDYYQRWQIMSFTRILRYIVSFLAFALPGLYVALLNFQPAMLPTPFAISIAASRAGITFSTVVEILIMELTFELFREAGIRIPGAIGHVIGLVGGIVIGQAAVDANIISPMIIIIISFTAICSFAIPDYSLTSAFRLIRYLFIALSAVLGLYGFLLAMLIILAHLSSLESFKIPYLAPYNIMSENKFNDLKDTLLRFPTFMQTRRPIFARENQRTRLRLKIERVQQDVPPGSNSATTNDNHAADDKERGE